MDSYREVVNVVGQNPDGVFAVSPTTEAQGCGPQDPTTGKLCTKHENSDVAEKPAPSAVGTVRLLRCPGGGSRQSVPGKQRLPATHNHSRNTGPGPPGRHEQPACQSDGNGHAERTRRTVRRHGSAFASGGGRDRNVF